MPGEDEEAAVLAVFSYFLLSRPVFGAEPLMYSCITSV